MRRVATLVGAGILSVVLMVALLAGTPGLAMAQQTTPTPPLTMQQLRWNEIQQRLGLTPDQATTLQGLLGTSRVTMQGDFQALKAARQQLHVAWQELNPAAIQAAAGQVQAAHAKLAGDRLNTRLQILQTLGPDQYKQWQALHKHHRHGGRHGFGPGM